MKPLLFLLLSFGFLVGCQSFEEKENRANIIMQSGVALYEAGRFAEQIRYITKTNKNNTTSTPQFNAFLLSYKVL